jgi:hypothetical protein
MKLNNGFCFWLSLELNDADIPKVQEILQVPMRKWQVFAPKLEEADERRHLFYGEMAWLLDLIEPKRIELMEAGVHFEESQVWMLYYYEEQCNMEFDSVLLKRMGDLGLKLCISCVADNNDEEV